MKIAVPREIRAGETRVALDPESCRKLVALGIEVAVEAGAGVPANFPDEAYLNAGASLAADTASLLGHADFAVKVNAPQARPDGTHEVDLLQPGSMLLASLFPTRNLEAVKRLAERSITAFSTDCIPRTTRAQAMDTLSSQANIVGYKGVLLGALELPKYYPMFITAAGTTLPAKVFVIGAGVAGLQAIATAKRLGAVIEASDVRPSVKEQIESLGGKFIEVSYDTPEEKEAAVGVGGYAKPMPPSWLARQQVEVAKRIALADIVISTALIPGRPAPTLITEEMVKAMKPGSVIVDIAAGKGPNGGGNCPLTVAGQTVQVHGVNIIGETNLPALVAADASALYARNVLDFLKLIVTKEGGLAVPMDDDIVVACLMTQGGEVKRK